MAKIGGICKDVLCKAEWVAIATAGGDRPHLVGTWGDYVKVADDEMIIIPAGHYNKTEENLKKNKDIQLLVATRQVKGNYGPGQGCCIYGEGEIQTEGENVHQVKEKFPWARGALVVKVKKVECQL